MMARGQPFRLLRQMSRGRTFAMDYRPLAGGGWVTLVEDVTERQRKEYDAAHPVRALRPGHQPHVARPVRGRRRAPHRAVQSALPRDVRAVGGCHPGRRLDARHHRARRGARIFPRRHAGAGLAAAAGEDGGRQAVPAAPEPAQRPRLHPALSSDVGRRLGHAVRGRDRAPSHGARAARCSTSASTRRSIICRTGCACSARTSG